MKIVALSFSVISMLVVAQPDQRAFRLGIENMPQEMIVWLRPQRVGLITNQTGRDQRGKRTVDILLERTVNVVSLFAPEHGFQGTVAASHDVHDGIDTATGIPVISLYSKATGKLLSVDMVQNIDVLIFDIQDSGMRHYTYIATLLHVIRAAAAHKKPLVVLDRPNPLGRVVEGPLVDQHLSSFISVASIPLRHGMTVGELANYFNTSLCDGAASVHVVPMHGYTGAPTVAGACSMKLSPNIQSLASCHGYSFLGLLGEIRPFDVGIGTPLAFQCIMLPKELKVSISYWRTLQRVLEKYGITSEPYTYWNTCMKRKREMVGLRITIKDVTKVSTCQLLAAIVHSARNAGITISFADSFDKSIGSSQIRFCLQGTVSWSDVMRIVHTQTQDFHTQARTSFIYTPTPRVIEHALK